MANHVDHQPIGGIPPIGSCLDQVRETSEKVDLIRKRLKTAQDRQKSYADRRRSDLEFKVGDMVFVKVSPLRNVMRFGSVGKLAPRFVGPFPITV